MFVICHISTSWMLEFILKNTSAMFIYIQSELEDLHDVRISCFIGLQFKYKFELKTFKISPWSHVGYTC